MNESLSAESRRIRLKSLSIRSCRSYPSMCAHFPFISLMRRVVREKVKIPAWEFSNISRYFLSSALDPSAKDDVTNPIVTKITNHAVDTAVREGSKLLKK